MAASVHSPSSTTVSETPRICKVKWEKYKCEAIKKMGVFSDHIVDCQELIGTRLSCSTETEAGAWRTRQTFIETLITDVMANCPKDEDLVVISFGASQLLPEYIIGNELIENNFRKISFLLVDPVYSYCSEELKKNVNQSLADFRKKLEAAYFDKYKEPLPKDDIRYLSRSQNIAKCFPQNANVVVIEGLPPYAKIIQEIHQCGVEMKSPEHLMAGNFIVPAEIANAVMFIPKKYKELMQNTNAKFTHSIAFAAFKNDLANTLYYVDWGVKIRLNGEYYVSFTGKQYYFRDRGITDDRPIQLPSGEVVLAKEIIPKMQQAVERALDANIKDLLSKSKNGQLSSENVTSLLKMAHDIVVEYIPDIPTYFLADYVVDTSEAMEYLKKNAGHHYRKRFMLKVDINRPYTITKESF